MGVNGIMYQVAHKKDRIMDASNIILFDKDLNDTTFEDLRSFNIQGNHKKFKSEDYFKAVETVIDN
eukprot:14257474-Ditylum_brightwellii.AAC.2